MYLSKIIKTNSASYLYEAVNNRIVDLPEEVLDEIESGVLSNRYYSFLNNNKFRNLMDPIEFNIKYYYKNDELEWLVKNRMKSLTLSLTEQCNLRCKYCSYMPKYSSDTYKLKNMAEDTAIKSIDIFMRFSKYNPTPSIGFYGGEPLLRFDLIKNCVNYCKKKYPFSNPIFDVTTNGLLLKEDYIINFLIKNNFNINLSLDGPKKIHDKFRLDINDNPSFERVIKNLNKLYRKSPKFVKNNVSINSVITPITGGKEQFDYLESLCRLDVIPIEVMESDYFSQYLNHYRGSIKKDDSFDKLKYSFLKKGILKEACRYHSAYRYGGSRLNLFPGGFCVPGSHRIFVTPEGKFLICERVDDFNDDFCIGDADTGVDISRIRNLLSLAIEKVDVCKSCWAAKMCDICFRDIFNITDKFCKNKKQGIEYGMSYYLDKFKDDEEIISVIENFA